MGTELSNISTEVSMKVGGQMIIKMVKEYIPGLMEMYMTGNFKMVYNMEMEL